MGHGLDDLLLGAFGDAFPGIVQDLFGMLASQHHGINPQGLIIFIFDRHLGFAIRAQISPSLVYALLQHARLNDGPASLAKA